MVTYEVFKRTVSFKGRTQEQHIGQRLPLFHGKFNIGQSFHLMMCCIWHIQTVLWYLTPGSARTTQDRGRTALTGLLPTALLGSFLQRVSADALQAHQGRQAAIMVSARMERFLCAWRKKTAPGVPQAMQTTRGQSPLNAPAIKQNRDMLGKMPYHKCTGILYLFATFWDTA